MRFRTHANARTFSLELPSASRHAIERDHLEATRVPFLRYFSGTRKEDPPWLRLGSKKIPWAKLRSHRTVTGAPRHSARSNIFRQGRGGTRCRGSLSKLSGSLKKRPPWRKSSRSVLTQQEAIRLSRSPMK